MGAYAREADDVLSLRAFLADVDGKQLLTAQAEGKRSDALAIGRQVALELLDAGGRQLLDELEQNRDEGDIHA